jgi:hypothetical protein
MLSRDLFYVRGEMTRQNEERAQLEAEFANWEQSLESAEALQRQNAESRTIRSVSKIEMRDYIEQADRLV